MSVRSTMSDLISLVREQINDPAGTSQQFSDQQIQDRLDLRREEIRYEALKIAPSIVNAVSTNNQAAVIYADYYSAYQYWEADVAIQGYSNGSYWVVLSPSVSELFNGHWAFETNIFTSGTAPGQLPPLFATGKVFDPYAASADLLEYWAATMMRSYDISAEGQNLRRSQIRQAMLEQALYYRRMSRPRIVKLIRTDLPRVSTAHHQRLLDSDDVLR